MITTHVLDTAKGRPAAGVAVELDRRDQAAGWRRVGQGATDGDGRLRTLTPDGEALAAGCYRLTFATGEYFRSQGVASFYPRVSIEFTTSEGESHYHVPLLVSPFGYSTYRGT